MILKCLLRLVVPIFAVFAIVVWSGTYDKREESKWAAMVIRPFPSGATNVTNYGEWSTFDLWKDGVERSYVMCRWRPPQAAERHFIEIKRKAIFR